MVTKTDVHGKYNFEVEVDHIPAAAFQKVAGMGVEISTFEYREGDDEIWKQEFPATVKAKNVTFSKGVVDDGEGGRDFWNWVKACIDGDETMKRTAILYQNNRAGQHVRKWVLERCFPVDYTVPDEDAEDDSPAVDELEVSVGKLTRGDV